MSDQITNWSASDLSEKKLESLEKIGMLPDKSLISWRSVAGEHSPSNEDGEIPIFLAYIECGFRFPIHPFLPTVLENYGVELVNLAPNAIANVSIFIYLCEAYLGIPADLDLFKYYYRMTKSGKTIETPGECTLRLHDGKADVYILMYSKSSWSSWKKSWFYMTVTKKGSLYYSGKKAVENPRWRSSVEKEGKYKDGPKPSSSLVSRVLHLGT